jgi:hypothetical protein
MSQLTDLLDAFSSAEAMLQQALLDTKRLEGEIKVCKDKSDLLAVYCAKEMEGRHWLGLKSFDTLILDNTGNDVFFRSIHQRAEEKRVDGKFAGYNFVDKPDEQAGEIHGRGLVESPYGISLYISLGNENIVLPKKIVEVASEYLARKAAGLPELGRPLREKSKRFSQGMKINPTPIPPYVSPERDYAIFKVEGKTHDSVVGGTAVRSPCYYLTIGKAK